MIHVAYYISGHGYGHAVRSIEIIQAMSRQNPFCFFHIKTTAPEWLFKLNQTSNIIYYLQENDVGTVQRHFREVDKIATLQKLRKLFREKKSFIAAEKRFLQKFKIRLVLGDIPPLAFAAAQACGIPAVAIGNFSWDWIYSKYVDELPEFQPMIEEIQSDYSGAEMLLRLPMHGPMPAFRRIEEVPLVARKAQRKARDVRRLLGVRDSGLPLVLVALRDPDLQTLQWQALSRLRNYQLIFVGKEKPPLARAIHLAQASFPFVELIHAVDAAVSKPGYGIVSDCIANRTPLVYTHRKDFLEYGKLVRSLRKYAVSAYLPPGKFFSGQWQPALEKVVGKPWDRPDCPANGAEIISELLQTYLPRSARKASS